MQEATPKLNGTVSPSDETAATEGTGGHDSTFCCATNCPADGTLAAVPLFDDDDTHETMFSVLFPFGPYSTEEREGIVSKADVPLVHAT